jgi:hypothetical protein
MSCSPAQFGDSPLMQRGYFVSLGPRYCFSGTLSIEPGTAQLLDLVRAAIRRLNYSRRTGEAYVHWIKRDIFFHGKRHPNELGESEATAFLSHLAVERKVAAATQAQARAAYRVSAPAAS